MAELLSSTIANYKMQYEVNTDSKTITLKSEALLCDMVELMKNYPGYKLAEPQQRIVVDEIKTVPRWPYVEADPMPWMPGTWDTHPGTIRFTTECHRSGAVSGGAQFGMPVSGGTC